MLDADQQVVDELRYLPFGQPYVSDPNTAATDYAYTGQRWQSDIGLHHYGARWYNPSLGRFISPDTIVPNPGNPQDLNRYTYVRNSPLNYVDPTGHKLDPGGADISSCGGSAGYLNCVYPQGHELAGWPIGISDAELAQAAAGRTAFGSAVVDFTPGVGDAKGFIEVFTGNDLATGERLDAWRFLGLLGVSELRHLRHTDEVVEVASDVVRKRIVIGEGMEAVKTAAREHNAKWYQAWSKYFSPENFDLEGSLARNERWIREKIRQGYEILDIGLDPDRLDRSPFYELERRILDEPPGYPTMPIERPD